MTFVVCPSCGRSYSGASGACSYCGRHAASPGGAGASPVTYVITRDAPDDTRSDTPTHTFFPVAMHKFVVMSICTLGIYQQYWCYQNWVRIERRERHGISPLLRAIFAPLFSFSLFSKIRGGATSQQLPIDWSPSLLGAGYVALSASARLPSAWWMLSMLSFVAFIPVVQSVQTLHAKEFAAEGRNGTYSGANIAAIAFGVLCVLLIVVGRLLPTPSS